MGNEKHYADICPGHRFRPRLTCDINCSSTFFTLIVLSIIVALPSGSSVPHIASVLQSGDTVPGIPMKPVPRGPTVAPIPSQETLKQLELNSRDPSNDGLFFNPAEAIRNLLSLSSSSTSHRMNGLKRLSQLHGNGDAGAGLLGTANYRPAAFPNSWEYEDEDLNQVDENGQPTFVPFIGARALTNIPQFFEHLKENIEALKLAPPAFSDDQDGNNESGGGDSNGEVADDLYSDSDTEERFPRKDISKPAARRMKTEFHVDESVDDGSDRSSLSSKQNWKPRAAGTIHYYAPRSNFLDSQQSILRRANNFNPAWLYTNLGLGKRRRR